MNEAFLWIIGSEALAALVLFIVKGCCAIVAQESTPLRAKTACVDIVLCEILLIVDGIALSISAVGWLIAYLL